MDQQNTITFTSAATNKISTLIAAKGNLNLKLRVYIVGGGCSGFQYGFKFDETINEDDVVIKQENATMVVDVMSMQYLLNAVVDYIENLKGAQFIVQNPNAETTCGCGSSFSLKEEPFEES
jgi:iron-sulfur cluster insertion protein